MSIQFRNEDHEKRFQEARAKLASKRNDVYRCSALYILTAFDDVACRLNAFYDFKENQIRPEALEAEDLCSSSRALVRLAFHLYNDYYGLNVGDYFCYGQEFAEVGLEAIKIRFEY